MGEVRQSDLPPPNMPTKQSRSEIDDKFCKFEIKKLIEGKHKIDEDTYANKFPMNIYCNSKVCNIIYLC